MNKTLPTYPGLDILRFRHHAKSAIRAIFDSQGFLELDTPYLLSANTPDPFIDPIFAEAHGLAGRALQLHTSPEIWLKRGLALGLPKIYQMARVFRDDPPGKHHSREFTMLEWYRTDCDLTDLLVDCDDIFRSTLDVAFQAGLVAHSRELSFIKTNCDFLFKELAGIDLPRTLASIAAGSRDHLQKELVEKKRDHLPNDASFSDAFFHVMLKYIEPNLPRDRPVVISRWPLQLAALAAPCNDNPHYCDRFEIYYQGLEIANAYQECIDPSILRARFIDENRDRTALGKPCFAIDEGFLTSVSQMPKTAGIALGVDRLFLAILEREDISQIIFGFLDH